MWNNIKKFVLVQIQRVRAHWPAIAAWVKEHKKGIIQISLAAILIFITIRSCTSTAVTPSPTPGGGYFFWKVVFLGLIVSAFVSYRRNPANVRFPAYYLIGAGLVFLILLGNLHSFFSWSVLGLPLFAFAGIWLWERTEGRMKSFLGFSSGLIILAWMLLFIQANIRPNLDFLGDRVTDSVNLMILFLALGLIVFATWKRSKLWLIPFFIVLVAWLGPEVFHRIADRYPNQLKPSVPTSVAPIGSALGKIFDSFATDLKAKATKSEVTSRQNAQAQSTSQVPSGTVIYNCGSSGDCSPTDLKYKKPVAGILLNEHIEQNGATYEKVSLPDPVTSQPGKIIGWIPTSELLQKPTSESSTERESKIPFYPPTQEVSVNGKTLYGALIDLPAGRYIIDPAADVYLIKSNAQLVRDGRELILDKNQELVHIIAKSKPIRITPQ